MRREQEHSKKHRRRLSQRRGERKMIDGVGFVKKVEFEALQPYYQRHIAAVPQRRFKRDGSQSPRRRNLRCSPCAKK